MIKQKCDEIAYIRGNRVTLINSDKNIWIYDDGIQTDLEVDKALPCGRCGKPPTKEGHDTCLGTLPEIWNACCGHGHDVPYIQFEDEEVFRMIIKILKGINTNN